MSSDFGFWKQCEGHPEEVFDNIAEGDTTGLVSSADVVRFREELLGRWEDIKDSLEPSEYSVENDGDDPGVYVLLTLPVRHLDYLDEVLKLAKKHRLVGYSGVAGEPIY